MIGDEILGIENGDDPGLSIFLGVCNAGLVRLPLYHSNDFGKTKSDFRIFVDLVL